MTRTRQSAKAAGSRFERAIADYLAEQLDDDRIDRRVKRGNSDRGDIAGLRIHGQRVVAECKDRARLDLPGWTAEAHIQAGHDDALIGVVIHKRTGVGGPGQQWVSMTVDDFCALISGNRCGHRKDFTA